MKFKDGRAKGRVFCVGGINGNGWDAESLSNKPMLSVTFTAWGRGARMDCLMDDMEKVVE